MIVLPMVVCPHCLGREFDLAPPETRDEETPHALILTCTQCRDAILVEHVNLRFPARPSTVDPT